LLASGGLDGTVRLWDAADGRAVAALTGHTGGVIGVAFSPDGRALVSGGEDGVVQLWDLERLAIRRTLRPDRRSERLDITGLAGVTAAQRTALLALGAVERAPAPDQPLAPQPLASGPEASLPPPEALDPGASLPPPEAAPAAGVARVGRPPTNLPPAR